MRNNPCRFPSHKLGHTVSLESMEEHGYAIQLEYDADVLEYWEQPPQVALITTDSAGRRRRANYFPDFLVLFKDRVEVVQVKTREQCLENVKQYPARWTLEGDTATDLAACAYFRGIGLKHQVYISGGPDKVRVENYNLLLRARTSGVTLQELKQLAKVLSRAPDDAIWSLEQLLTEAGLTNATAVLRLLDEGALFSDLRRCRISAPAQCLVAKDSKVLHDHFAAVDRLESVGLDRSHMHSREIRVAIARQEEMRGDKPAENRARTHRRWRAMARKAPRDPIAMAPGHRRKGNRSPRHSPPEEKVLARSISRHFLNPLCPSAQAAYGQYMLDHEESIALGELPKSSVPISYTTYLKRCSQVSPELKAGARSGRRAANAHAHPVAPEHRHLTPTRAFDRAHIDHYLCDLHVLVARTDKAETRRPWLTAMRDEATGAILAISLSFRSPSHRSCAQVIRDCARRHNRLPEVLVVDNGAEFHSTYFECVLAGLGVTKQSRPPGNPRTGGQIEGWFHSVRAFLATQKGNTNNDARSRSASSSHKGRAQAVWPICKLFTALEEFTFTHFNHSPSPDALEARSHLVQESLARFPFSGRRATFDAEFLAQTSVPLRRGLKVDPARGVRHLGRWFSHPALFRGECNGKRLEAFEEPWDVNRLYVRCGGELITCIHGSPGNTDLSVDFGPALESLLFIECSDIRSKQAAARALSRAKLARKWERELTQSDRRELRREHTQPEIAWPAEADITPYNRRVHP